MMPLLFPVLKAEREAHTDIHVTHDEGFEEGCQFIDRLIITDFEEMGQSDFKIIRGRPFYKVDEGVYRIVFGLFVIEMLHKGLYFKLSELNKKLPIAARFKDFRGWYCDYFSERHLVYSLLNSIFGRRFKVFTGSEMKDAGMNGEPDYYVRNGNHQFLWESKDILINANIKSSYDFAQYEAAFRKKLYYDDKGGGKIENKAVLQLIKNVERSLTREFPFDTGYKPHLIQIYPILILHDHQYNVPGLNVLVNSWFMGELGKMKERGIDTKNVRQLIIIDIDTLIFHQDILRDRRIKLEEIIDAYIKFITPVMGPKYLTPEELDRAMKRTVVSFSTFLMNYVSDRKLKRIPKMVMSKGISLFS